MPIYLDILFFVNFAMDFLSLRLTSRIMHLPLRLKRASLASAFGALAGVAAVLLLSDKHILSFLVGGGASLLMSALAWGWNGVVRKTVVLWGAGAFVGGVFTLLLELVPGSDGYGGPPASLSTGKVGEIFILVSMLSCGLVRLFSSSHAKKTAELRFSLSGKDYSMTALCDSGNMAADPFTSSPVVIVASRAAELDSWKDGRAEDYDGSVRVRVIPIRTAAGEKLLYGFVPQSLTVNGIPREAVVAIDRDNSSYSGCGAIVPAVLT